MLPYLFTSLCTGGSFGCEESETSLSPVKPEALLENAAIDSELFEVGSSSEKFTDTMYIHKKKRTKSKIGNIKCCNLKILYCMILCRGQVLK